MELSTVSVVRQVELVFCSVLSLQMRYCSSHLLESVRVAINNNQFESIQLINVRRRQTFNFIYIVIFNSLHLLYRS